MSDDMKLPALSARVAELDAAADKAEVVGGLTHDGSLWRFLREQGRGYFAERDKAEARVAELEADCARLETAHRQMQQAHDALAAERDALRARVDQAEDNVISVLFEKWCWDDYNSAIAERDALRAEVEAARAEGWRAGAEAAAQLADGYHNRALEWASSAHPGMHIYDTDSSRIAADARALPIPPAPKGDAP